MSSEDIEKKMEFIIEQQAQFTVDIQLLREVLDTQSQQISELKTQIGSLSLALNTVVGLVGQLTESQQRTEKVLNETNEKLTKVSAKLEETDERLNILITVVERYFSGNGAGEKKD